MIYQLGRWLMVNNDMGILYTCLAERIKKRVEITLPLQRTSAGNKKSVSTIRKGKIDKAIKHTGAKMNCRHGKE